MTNVGCLVPWPTETPECRRRAFTVPEGDMEVDDCSSPNKLCVQKTNSFLEYRNPGVQSVTKDLFGMTLGTKSKLCSPIVWPSEQDQPNKPLVQPAKFEFVNQFHSVRQSITKSWVNDQGWFQKSHTAVHSFAPHIKSAPDAPMFSGLFTPPPSESGSVHESFRNDDTFGNAWRENSQQPTNDINSAIFDKKQTCDCHCETSPPRRSILFNCALILGILVCLAVLFLIVVLLTTIETAPSTNYCIDLKRTEVDNPFQVNESF